MTERFLGILSSLTAPESAGAMYKKLVTGLDALHAVTYKVVPENEESRLPSASRYGGDPVRAEIPEDTLRILMDNKLFIGVLNKAKDASNQGLGRKGAALIKKALMVYFEEESQ